MTSRGWAAVRPKNAWGEADQLTELLANVPDGSERRPLVEVLNFQSRLALSPADAVVDVVAERHRRRGQIDDDLVPVVLLVRAPLIEAAKEGMRQIDG